jgi:Tfp pilus assembly protein PilP
MRFSKMLLVAGSLLLVPGCMFFGGDGDTEAEQEAGSSRKAKNKAASKAKSEAGRPSIDFDPEASMWHYNPIGKRDPFRSFVRGRLDEEIRSPTPLQRFDIDELDLSGIVWGVNAPRALVSDPDKKNHVVELGTYIGKNWGKVTEITSRSIVITEEYQTVEGSLMIESKIMSLPVEDNFY